MHWRNHVFVFLFVLLHRDILMMIFSVVLVILSFTVKLFVLVVNDLGH